MAAFGMFRITLCCMPYESVTYLDVRPDQYAVGRMKLIGCFVFYAEMVGT